MNFKVFFILSIIITIIIAHPHSKSEVRMKCGKSAFHHVQQICPLMCTTIDMSHNIHDAYCNVGLSDEQVKALCCPESSEE